VKQDTNLTTTAGTADSNIGSQMSSPCLCKRQISCYDENGVCFERLDATEKYFATVARSEAGSLFGLPSRVISPDEQSNRQQGVLVSSPSAQASRPKFTALDGSPALGNSPAMVPHSSEVLDESETIGSDEGDFPVNVQEDNSASIEALRSDEVKLQSAFEKDAKSWEALHATALHLLPFPAIPTFGTIDLVCGLYVTSTATDLLTFIAAIL
jgi:hypothetical protein